jgi:hypothetical protein
MLLNTHTHACVSNIPVGVKARSSVSRSEARIGAIAEPVAPLRRHTARLAGSGP